MKHSDFDLKALYEALDEQRSSRQMNWGEVTREINHTNTRGHAIARSTITGLKNKSWAEGDGVLQMLLWLGRSPESFIPGFIDTDAKLFLLREVSKGQILRWDTQKLYSALNAQRQARGMSWSEVAQEIGQFTPGMLAYLAKGGRASFPGVMRIVGWLGQPAATFTRISDW